MLEFPPNMIRGIGNCGIVAMAVCAGVDYMVAHEWFKTKQKPRGNWTGGTKHIYYGEFLREHGIWFEHVKYDRNRQRLIGDFVKWGAEPGKLYAIRSAGHMMVCRDGNVMDQHTIQNIDDGKFWKRNARIKDYWKIF